MLNKLRALHDRSQIRYLLAGGSAFLTEYLSFLVLFNVINAKLYVANSLSFCCGLLVSFSLNRSWTFTSDKFHHKYHRQLFMYGALALFNLVFINVLLGILNSIGIAPLIGKLVVMVAIVVWNYNIFKNVIFKKPQAK